MCIYRMSKVQCPEHGMHTPTCFCHIICARQKHYRDRYAPIKALSILRIMEQSHAKGFCSSPPDETCYRYYLLTSARRAVVPELGPLADQILNKLKDKQIVPCAESYGAAIRTWKLAALNPLFGDSRETSVRRVVELLQELTLAHHRSALRSVKPTTIHYNDALEALAASHHREALEQAQALLKTMQESSAADENSSDILPNADSYKWVLEAHVKSKEPNKLESAKTILQCMQDNYCHDKTASNNPNTKLALETANSIVGAVNAFVRVCASVRPTSTEQNTQVLREALRAVRELHSTYHVHPNSESYAEVLRVAKNLLSVGKERSRILKDIFQTCCDQGLVDEHVLQALKGAASEDQYIEWVIAESQDVEGTRMVPEQWTRNVGARKVITAAGRRSPPLSVDGRYTVTKAMKEFRMRKLRSRVNQRVLQGGRLKLDEKSRGKAIRIRLEDDFYSS
jgi:hypothetical protein